jgi:acyl carrier protein
MTEFGTNKNVSIDDQLDSDGEVEIIMGDNGDMGVQGKIIKVLTEQLGMRQGDVTADSTHDGLGMDSLDDVEVIMAIEEAFDLDISDCDAEKLQSVQQATAYVVGRLAETTKKNRNAH